MSNASSIKQMAVNPSSIDLSVKEGSNYYQLLFPYLELENGPKITQIELDNNFFTCPDSLQNNPIFEQWVAAKQAGDRAKVQASAVNFINSPQFIRYPQQLSHPLLALLEQDFSRLQSKEDVMHLIDRHFTSTDSLSEFLASPDYQTSLTNIWLTCFSLIIILDYEISWLDLLIGMLKKLNFIQKVLTQIQADQAWSVFNIELWLSSDLLLPVSVFPLPYAAMASAEGKAKVSPNQSTNVRPYAIGTLHRIEYQLMGYELGELQKVETVLSGEAREHQLNLTIKSNTQQGVEENQQAFDKSLSSHKEQDLLAHVQHTLANKQVTNTLDKYATQYIATSANASTSGSWTIDEKPRGGDEEVSSDFIKDVLAKTEQRVSRHVSHVKQVQLSYEQASKESQRFQNDKERHINGFYYWLNKRYRVQALESQKRLMIEISLDLKQDELQDELAKMIQLDQPKPISLSEYGVNQFSDILIDDPNLVDKAVNSQENGQANASGAPTTQTTGTQTNSTGTQATGAQANGTGIKPADENIASAYYLNLYQAYNIDNIDPAPRLTRSMNKSIRSQLSSSSQVLAIPKGYYASKLTLSALVSDSVSGLAVLLLGNVYHMSVTNGQANQEIDIEGEVEESIEVSFLAKLEALTCSSGTQESCPNQQIASTHAHTQIISLNLDLMLTQETLSQWQLGVYEVCQQAYQAELAAYKVGLEILKERLKTQDNKVTLSLINRELIKMSIKSLFEHSMAFVENVEGEPKELLAYQGYFDYTLEWDQLYCKLINYHGAHLAEQDKGDSLFKQNASTATTATTSQQVSEAIDKAQDDLVRLEMQETQSLPVLAELDSSLYLYRFLKAQEAKLLIPVKPGYEKRFMYFYETGRIWHGQENLVPINQGALALINDYKGLRHHLEGEKRIKEWQVCLPTVMSVIDDKSELDNIASHLESRR